jgi:TIR domain
MPKITISYRRTDSAIVGRIFDHLTSHYGKDAVFMDIDNVPFGIDFRSHTRDALLESGMLIAVVGPNWIGERPDGTVRIQDEADPVRVEIETAIANRTPIIPVLVDGAIMPRGDDLPSTLGNFAYLNAAHVASGRDFRAHVERLIGAIDQTLTPDAPVAAAPPTHPLAPTTAEPEHVGILWAQLLAGYVLLPLVLLLVAHHVIVNVLDLRTEYLWLACVLIPFAFGFALRWAAGARSGPVAAWVFATALGVFGAAGMTVSQSLSSGDPIMPQTRFEWWDNIDFAAAIALSFVAGHALARTLRRVLDRGLVNP